MGPLAADEWDPHALAENKQTHPPFSLLNVGPRQQKESKKKATKGNRKTVLAMPAALDTGAEPTSTPAERGRRGRNGGGVRRGGVLLQLPLQVLASPSTTLHPLMVVSLTRSSTPRSSPSTTTSGGKRQGKDAYEDQLLTLVALVLSIGAEDL